MQVTVNGVPLPPLVLNQLAEVVVDSSANMPTMFALTFVDHSSLPMIFDLLDGPTFLLGSQVKIMGNPNESTMPPVLPGVLIPDGEITAVEPEFGEDGMVMLVVRGYDKTHRLHRGKQTKTYLMMPDNMIWQQVCMAAGVPVSLR